mmetsp:Transcript_29796/g.43726  ORF Transcript_29796/g.43726 Transcript_29796/m.43726 type:complete len:83 (-) Transcript_29796:659-907(-)
MAPEGSTPTITKAPEFISMSEESKGGTGPKMSKKVMLTMFATSLRHTIDPSENVTDVLPAPVILASAFSMSTSDADIGILFE